MMAAASLTIDLVRFGEIETGVWCDRCFLPSALKVTVAIVHRMNVLGFTSAEVCEGCGKR